MNRPAPSVSTEIESGSWTCPLCGKQKSVIGSPVNNKSTPGRSLKNHLHSAVDETHGGPHSYPEEVDIDDLDEYIEEPTKIVSGPSEAPSKSD